MSLSNPQFVNVIKFEFPAGFAAVGQFQRNLYYPLKSCFANVLMSLFNQQLVNVRISISDIDYFLKSCFPNLLISTFNKQFVNMIEFLYPSVSSAV